MIVRQAGRTAAYAYIDELSNILWRDNLMDDNIKSPKHYKLGDLNIEAIDVIRAVLGDAFPEYCRGNALKYLIRAGKKDDILQDLKKARVYLNWEIEAREKRRAEGGSRDELTIEDIAKFCAENNIDVDFLVKPKPAETEEGLAKLVEDNNAVMEGQADA